MNDDMSLLLDNNTLSQSIKDDLINQIQTFIQFHSNGQRPICFITSGGTVADLECNVVRSIENFSTGLRGSILVEQFISRGYAVIFLCREGSTEPYTRILNQYLQIKQSNFCMKTKSFHKLFNIIHNNKPTPPTEVSTNEKEQKDPWLYESETYDYDNNNSNNHHSLIVNDRLSRNSNVQKAFIECNNAINNGLLHTIYFRTVEDYLCKLQIISEQLAVLKSLCMMILAAAVSDYYIPISERTIHKIQSTTTTTATNNNNGCLTLTLHPVPKTLGILRTKWAPSAFIVSFKLETDINMLRHKSEQAIEKYNCHIVIGNILQTRYEKVWILSSPSSSSSSQSVVDNSNHQVLKDQQSSSVKDWIFTEIKKEVGDDNVDSLESLIVDSLVTSHFEYLSNHYNHNNHNNTTLNDIYNNNHIKKKQQNSKKNKVHNDISNIRLQNFILEIAGATIAFFISYSISTILRGRIRTYTS